jgi:Domain of unknown function (DUF4149)
MSPRRAARAVTKLSQSATSKASITSKPSVASKTLRVSLVLWAGSLWSLAIWVAPTMFYAQSDRHLAGTLVTRLFSVETYVALAVSALMLLTAGRVAAVTLARARFRFAYLAAALLSVNEWLLKPVMNRAHIEGQALGLGFGAWHGVSALVYVAACVLVLLLIWNDDLR